MVIRPPSIVIQGSGVGAAINNQQINHRGIRKASQNEQPPTGNPINVRERTGKAGTVSVWAGEQAGRRRCWQGSRYKAINEIRINSKGRRRVVKGRQGKGVAVAGALVGARRRRRRQQGKARRWARRYKASG